MELCYILLVDKYEPRIRSVYRTLDAAIDGAAKLMNEINARAVWTLTDELYWESNTDDEVYIRAYPLAG